MTLDNFFVEKARNELRETEARKKQSLELFRDWIQKHPFLKDVRQDDRYLLCFLRAKKYDINNAKDVFEKYFLAKKKYPQFLPEELPSIEFFQEILKHGFCFPLYGRDSEGCRIVLVQTRRLNTDKYSITDGIKLSLFTLAVILEDEESQIAGIKLILDHQDITTKHMMKPKDIIDFADLMKKVAPARERSTVVVNLPKIAYFIMEMFKTLLPEKLKKRLFLFQNWDEAKESQQVEEKMLPKELGGVKTEEELIQDFQDEVKLKWDIITETFNKSKLVWANIPEVERHEEEIQEGVGSFRKLDID